MANGLVNITILCAFRSISCLFAYQLIVNICIKPFLYTLKK